MLIESLLNWSTFMPFILFFLLLFVTLPICYPLVWNGVERFVEYRKFVQQINKISGPAVNPLNPLGHLYMFEANDKVDEVSTLFNTFNGLAKVYSPKCSIIRLWVTIKPMILFFKADSAEKIFSSNVHIDKAAEYQFLNPWLGTGLLTGSGAKWAKHRKLLTPTFHYNILEAFLPVMNEQANILVSKIQNYVKQINANGTILDITPFITYAALDVISETAMGVKINSQSNPNNDYVQATHRMGHKVIKRYIYPLRQSDFFYFNFTADGREERRDIKILHDFTMKVIRERKREMMDSKISNENENSFRTRKRLAFLDLLIEQHLKDPNSLTEVDMREEVDTFMFAGHDTTTVSMIWTLFLLGHHPEAQEQIHNEIDHIWERDNLDESRSFNSNQLREMKYLEACIKESLRLYPSVPYIGRLAAEDIPFDDYVIPKGSTLLMLIYAIQRDPKVFPKPNAFIPDRFVEHSNDYVKLSSFAYVPFSAGPRNCIGQKFGLQEEKVLLATLLRHFSLQSVKQEDEIASSPEMVMRPKEPINILFVPRVPF